MNGPYASAVSQNVTPSYKARSRVAVDAVSWTRSWEVITPSTPTYRAAGAPHKPMRSPPRTERGTTPLLRDLRLTAPEPGSSRVGSSGHERSGLGSLCWIARPRLYLGLLLLAPRPSWDAYTHPTCARRRSATRSVAAKEGRGGAEPRAI